MKFNISLLSLSAAIGLASACLYTQFSISAGLDVIVYLSTDDNGVRTCEGHREGEGAGMNHGEIHCINGYSLHYDVQKKGALVTYGTPHGEYKYYVQDRELCNYSNCCGGKP